MFDRNTVHTSSFTFSNPWEIPMPIFLPADYLIQVSSIADVNEETSKDLLTCSYSNQDVKPDLNDVLPQHTRFTSTEENIRLYKQKNYQDASVDDQRNIYVCRLNKKTDEEQLKQLVQRCGEVESVKIIYEQENSKQKSKGYGFILFKTNEAAAKAVTFLRSEGFGASFAKPSLSLKLKELHDNNSTNLYFANLPLFWEERELLQLMEQKGFNDDQIQSIRVMRKKYMDCSFGFVKLESRSTAEEVIKALNGSMLKENGRALGVRFADTFEQKKLKTTIRQRSSSSAASVSE